MIHVHGDKNLEVLMADEKTSYSEMYVGADPVEPVEEKPVDPVDPVDPVEEKPVDPVEEKPVEEKPIEDETAKAEAEAAAKAAEVAAEAAVKAAEVAAEAAVEAAEAYSEALDDGRVVAVKPEPKIYLRANIDDIGKLRVRETPDGAVKEHITNKYMLALIDDADPVWALVEYNDGMGNTVRGYVKKSFVTEA
jgi:hypothetical protein